MKTSAAAVAILFIVGGILPARMALAQVSPLPPPLADASASSALTLRLSDDRPLAGGEANHRSTLTWGGLYLAASLSALVLFPPDNWHGNIVPHPEQFARSWTSAPTWHDGDPWTTNYVGHPIMGSVLSSVSAPGRPMSAGLLRLRLA